MGSSSAPGILETRRGVGTFVTATPAQAHPPKQHERRLRAFVTRLLADAAAAGFTLDDLLDATTGTSKGRCVMADFAVPGNMPRLNVISLGVFLVSIALAVFAGVRTKARLAPIVIMLVGVVADAVAAHRPAVGARRGAAARPLRRPARPGPVLDRAVRRLRLRPGSTSARSPPGSPPNRR